MDVEPPSNALTLTFECRYPKLSDVFCELEKIAHMQYFSFRVTVSGLRSRDEDGVKVLNVKVCTRSALCRIHTIVSKSQTNCSMNSETRAKSATPRLGPEAQYAIRTEASMH